jgi:ketosteroid isomerase-like protein
VSDVTEHVRWLTTVYNSGDWDTLREWYAPDIVVDAGELWPVAGPVRGVDRVIAEFTSIFATFQDVEVVGEEYIERNGAIVVPSLWRGKVAGSDSVIEQALAAVYRLQGRRMASIQYFPDLDTALAAADAGPLA